MAASRTRAIVRCINRITWPECPCRSRRSVMVVTRPSEYAAIHTVTSAISISLVAYPLTSTDPSYHAYNTRCVTDPARPLPRCIATVRLEDTYSPQGPSTGRVTHQPTIRPRLTVPILCHHTASITTSIGLHIVAFAIAPQPYHSYPTDTRHHSRGSALDSRSQHRNIASHSCAPSYPSHSSSWPSHVA